MKSQMKKIPFEALNFDPELNVRDPHGYDYSKGEDLRLLTDIKTNGLIDRLEVYEKEDGTYDGLKGFRRYGAIKELFEHDRTVFEKWFKDGVMCVVHSNATEEERLNIMADHGVKKLDQVGRHRVCKRYFGLGWTEGAIMKRTGFARGVVQISNMLTKLPQVWEDAKIAYWRGDQGARQVTDLSVRAAYNTTLPENGGKCSLTEYKDLSMQDIWDRLGANKEVKTTSVRSKTAMAEMKERIRNNEAIKQTLMWCLGHEIDLVALDK